MILISHRQAIEFHAPIAPTVYKDNSVLHLAAVVDIELTIFQIILHLGESW